MFKVGDKLTTKKPHACGGKTWQVTRVGADYKIKCETCGREIMLTLSKLNKMIKPTPVNKTPSEEKQS